MLGYYCLLDSKCYKEHKGLVLVKNKNILQVKLYLHRYKKMAHVLGIHYF